MARDDLDGRPVQAEVQGLSLVELRELIPKAEEISEKKRREGYSVLTDKLLENVKTVS